MFRLEQELAGPGALLIYNGAPFPRLSETPHWAGNGYLHRHADGMLGRRPHIAELNAMARQVCLLLFSRIMFIVCFMLVLICLQQATTC